MEDPATCSNWSEPTFPSTCATLEPSHFPIFPSALAAQSAEAAISLAVKHRGHEADHSPLCFHSLIYLHGMYWHIFTITFHFPITNTEVCFNGS